MNTDDVGAEPGWYLDDIRVYTCSSAPVPKSTPADHGSSHGRDRTDGEPGRWSPSDAKKRLQWYADGHAIAGATGTLYVVRGADLGKRLSVKVTARSHGSACIDLLGGDGPVTSV